MLTTGDVLDTEQIILINIHQGNLRPLSEAD